MKKSPRMPRHDRSPQHLGPPTSALKSCALGAVIATVTSTSAWAGNGVQTYETDGFLDPTFVACLNEYIFGPFHVIATAHDFYTPSGTYHIVDNWKLTQLLEGETSGRQWLNSEIAPQTVNVFRDGEAISAYVENGLARPVDDGPMISYELNVKFKYDENGDPVLVVISFATGDFKCIGPKNQ